MYNKGRRTSKKTGGEKGRILIARCEDEPLKKKEGGPGLRGGKGESIGVREEIEGGL